MSGFQDINIQPYIRRHNLVNFIETGCHTGSGIQHAIANGLPNIYSCDINKQFVDLCRYRFPNAYIMHKHSVDFLNEVVDVLPGNSLFWLDAHFPELTGGVSSNQEEFFPLFNELKVLSEISGIENSVIMIDDIRVIQSDDNPIKQEFDDKYKIYGTTIKDLTDLFPNHNYEVVNFQEGLLIFTPKV